MTANRLIQAGALLFLLGLLTGFAVPAMASPRLALSGHLEGVMNGILLMVAGLIWPRLMLSATSLKASFWLLVYGTYVNWITVVLAALWGAGGAMMPIAGGPVAGTAFQEGLVKFGLISLSIAMVAAFCLILWGLRNPKPSP